LVNVPDLATGEPALEASLGGRRRQSVSLADRPTANHRQPSPTGRIRPAQRSQGQRHWPSTRGRRHHAL